MKNKLVAVGICLLIITVVFSACCLVLYAKSTESPYQYIVHPSFSHDGKKIVFSASGYDDLSHVDIFVMNSDGTDVQRILSNSVFLYPSFSPDDSKLIFYHAKYGFAEDWDLATMNSDGRNFREIILPGREWLPQFSPDGKTIVFSAFNYDSGGFNCDINTTGIWIANTDGTNLKQIVQGYAYYPSFSPDGKKIVYTTPDQHIWMVNLDTLNSSKITNDNYSKETPSFSPDGRKIVYASDEDGQIFRRTGLDGPFNATYPDIWIMDSDGSNHTQLTDLGKLYARYPSFSPDGKKIIYVVDNGGVAGNGVDRGAKIWIMDSDGKNKEKLTGLGNNNIVLFFIMGLILSTLLLTFLCWFIKKYKKIKKDT